jgi:hypothetical protein
MYESTSSTPRFTRIRGRLGTPWRPLRAASVGLAGSAIVTAAFLGSAGQATAKPPVLKVKGHYKSQLAGGPGCQAATGRCFAGRIYGRTISGSFTGEINSITPTAQEDVMLIDAATRIRTKRGSLYFAHQQAVYNVNPTGRGEFSWILRITRGTGRFAGATGYLAGAGNTPPSTGRSTSTYFGEIKLAR